MGPHCALGLFSSLLQAVQSIGNLGQQLGQGKEQWLAPLHPFLLQSISRVRDFLDQLVDVDEDEGESCGPSTPGLSPPPSPGSTRYPTPLVPSTKTLDLQVN